MFINLTIFNRHLMQLRKLGIIRDYYIEIETKGGGLRHFQVMVEHLSQWSNKNQKKYQLPFKDGAQTALFKAQSVPRCKHFS
jgi:hypothetical protein